MGPDGNARGQQSDVADRAAALASVCELAQRYLHPDEDYDTEAQRPDPDDDDERRGPMPSGTPSALRLLPVRGKSPRSTVIDVTGGQPLATTRSSKYPARQMGGAVAMNEVSVRHVAREARAIDQQDSVTESSNKHCRCRAGTPRAHDDGVE